MEEENPFAGEINNNNNNNNHNIANSNLSGNSNALQSLSNFEQLLRNLLNSSDLDEFNNNQNNSQANNENNNNNDNLQENENEREDVNNNAAERNAEGEENSLSIGQHTFDLQGILAWTESILPIAILLLLIFIFNHIIGIVVFTLNLLVSYKCNNTIKKEFQKKMEERNKKHLIYVLNFSFIHITIGIILLFQNAEELSLILFPGEINSFWEVLFIVTLNDSILRFVTLSVKAFVLSFYSESSRKKKSLLFSCIELLFSFYRVCLPTPVWLMYFLSMNSNYFFNMAILGSYATWKYPIIIKRGILLHNALKTMWNQKAIFGVTVSQEELLENGITCSICREDMQSPIKLSCSHIFCEECVSEWFQRKTTCPLCRTVIRSAGGQPTHCDGSISTEFLIF